MTREMLIMEMRGLHTFAARADALLERRARLRARLYAPGAPALTGTPKSGEPQSAGFENMVAAIDRLENQIAALIARETERRYAVDLLLDRAEPVGRAVLDLHYIKNCPMWMVAQKLHYDRSWCWVLANRAIDTILSGENRPLPEAGEAAPPQDVRAG